MRFKTADISEEAAEGMERAITLVIGSFFFFLLLTNVTGFQMTQQTSGFTAHLGRGRTHIVILQPAAWRQTAKARNSEADER